MAFYQSDADTPEQALHAATASLLKANEVS